MTVPNTALSGPRRFLSGFSGFAVSTLALIALSGFLLTFAFRGPGDGNAILVSAIVAAVLQIAAFPAVRGLAAKHIMIGWGAGTLVRFLGLIVYALLASNVLGLPLPAALISLMTFYFLSMVIEPLFLRS
jgi:hypothetical protein